MISLDTCVTLACDWETTAPKPGNVTRGADFHDLTYVDFLVSAAVIGPILDEANEQGVGRTLLAAVQATRAAVGTNTNLGILLLLTPLCAVPLNKPLATGVCGILGSLTSKDTKLAYQAISTAQPGGLGKVDQADVNCSEPPSISLVEAMHMAAERDLIARQYTNGFQQVFQMADWIESGTRQDWSLSEAIVHAFLQLLAEYPDSLIARKQGDDLARQVSLRAASVLASGNPGEEPYRQAVADLDFWLRSDTQSRNPGTSADFVAAGLFVLLREERLALPVQFYPQE